MLEKLTTNKGRNLSAAINTSPMVLMSLAMLVAICMFPEISLAADLGVVSAEGQLDKVGTLANGKLKTVGITVATVCGGTGAMIKGNPKAALIIVVIGIVLALFLEWVAGGMRLMAA